jgi:hypothetical protein
VPGFFQSYCDDVQRVHPREHPVGHGIIDQPMPGDVLQSIEPGVDHPHSKMTGATRGAGVADVQMALIIDLDCGLGKGLPKAFQQCIARGFYGVFLLHVFLYLKIPLVWAYNP